VGAQDCDAHHGLIDSVPLRERPAYPTSRKGVNAIQANMSKQETAMTTDKKPQNRQPETAKPDSLFNGANKGDIELTEDELKRSTGGAYEFYGKISKD
jgi:hypothetical protein